MSESVTQCLARIGPCSLDKLKREMGDPENFTEQVDEAIQYGGIDGSHGIFWSRLRPIAKNTTIIGEDGSVLATVGEKEAYTFG